MNDGLIYLVRPGQVQLAGAAMRYIGQLDLPLSGLGVRQAHSLGRVLRCARPTLIACSDLARSRQTAEIIAHYHPVGLQVRRDLREIDLGEWEGLTLAEIRQRFPAEFEEYGQDIAGYCPPGGESFLDCSRRTVTALKEILSSTRDRILIVGHTGVNRAILGHMLGLPLANLFQLDQDYGCYNVIRAGESGSRLVIFNRVLGDNGPLRAYPNNPLGDTVNNSGYT